MRYAIIDDKDMVLNIIEWDGVSEYEPELVAVQKIEEAEEKIVKIGNPHTRKEPIKPKKPEPPPSEPKPPEPENP